MPSERTSRILNPIPLLPPSENRCRTQSGDIRDPTPGELARMRIKALGVDEQPPRSVDSIPDWVLGGG